MYLVIVVSTTSIFGLSSGRTLNTVFLIDGTAEPILASRALAATHKIKPAHRPTHRRDGAVYISAKRGETNRSGAASLLVGS